MEIVKEKSKVIHLKATAPIYWFLFSLGFMNMYFFWSLSKLLVLGTFCLTLYWGYLALTYNKHKGRDHTLFYYERFSR